MHGHALQHPRVVTVPLERLRRTAGGQRVSRSEKEMKEKQLSGNTAVPRGQIKRACRGREWAREPLGDSDTGR